MHRRRMVCQTNPPRHRPGEEARPPTCGREGGEGGAARTREGPRHPHRGACRRHRDWDGTADHEALSGGVAASGYANPSPLITSREAPSEGSRRRDCVARRGGANNAPPSGGQPSRFARGGPAPPGQPAPSVGPSYLYPDPETTPDVTNPGEVLRLLDNETGMHSCLDSKPKVAGWRRRQEEASPWRREYRPQSGQARSSTSC